MKKYDVFISYRRDGGDDCAMWLKNRLERDGFHPYLDVEAHEPGDYTIQIDHALQESDSVIVLLTHHCLDRCTDLNDAVRKEIAESLELHKNIIPVMKRGFSFPPSMPEDIEPLRYCNALPLENYYRDAFYELLIKALRKQPVAPIERLGKKRKRTFSWSMRNGCEMGQLENYESYEWGHISADYRMVALVHGKTKQLIIRETDTQRVICVLPPLKKPFRQYQLVFGADSRYLYLTQNNQVHIFDIMRNKYVLKNEITISGLRKRKWDIACGLKEEGIVFLDYENGNVKGIAQVSVTGQTQYHVVEKYRFGMFLGMTQIEGKEVLILANPEGRLTALFSENQELYYQKHEEFVQKCLESGKRFSDKFGRENLYWAITSDNGITQYTDIFQTENGEHLHRVFHGNNDLCFTAHDTAVWYDETNGQLIEEDFVQQKNRILADVSFFSEKEEFYHRAPLLAVYMYEADIMVFMALSENADAFRLVLMDYEDRYLEVSPEYPCPAQAISFLMQQKGMHLAVFFQCQKQKEQRTELFTAHIREITDELKGETYVIN